jgi:hypothetical protein
MTLKDLRLGFSKRCYFERFIKMATQGELLKLHHFLPMAKTKIHGSTSGHKHAKAQRPRR